MKRAFKMKLTAFFIIFKGPSLKQIKQIFLEGESPTLIFFTKACICSEIRQLIIFNIIVSFSGYFRSLEVLRVKIGVLGYLKKIEIDHFHKWALPSTYQKINNRIREKQFFCQILGFCIH